MRYFVEAGIETHLASMFPSKVDLRLTSHKLIPVAFSQFSGKDISSQRTKLEIKRRIIKFVATPKIRTSLRHWFVPRTLKSASEILASHISNIQPDLVHAMRVPYEGMLAALSYQALEGPKPPLLISIWGNDFTLHALATQKMKTLTHLAMDQAGGLHTDCYRDQDLALVWGFDKGKPRIVIPGSGGVQLDIFYPQSNHSEPIIINPRGFRAYIRNDKFFQAIPLVLSRHPQARFLCPSMENQPDASKWVKSLGIDRATKLLPRQSRFQMADLLRMSQVVVSPSTHDGTPNTVLEAMACGSFPIVGDLESLREWINPGVNGLLVDPNDPHDLAEAISFGLENSELRQRARKINLDLIKEKAEFHTVMSKATDFYEKLIN
jgi:glycosyltransferase involved in cell wall biosynthesis